MSPLPLQAPDPDAGTETILRDRFAATATAVSAVLTGLEAILVERSVGEAFRADILLALGEILNNIVEHSVTGLDDPEVHLDVTLAANRLHVETVDAGRPLPPPLLSPAQLPAMPESIDALPEGGFGWFIIHSLAQDMVYEREAGKNRLSFSFDIA